MVNVSTYYKTMDFVTATGISMEVDGSDPNVTDREIDNFWNSVSPIPEWIKIIIGAVLLFISVVTFVLNALVVLTFTLRWRSKKTPVEWCIINLAITGIFPPLMSYPLYAMSCFRGGWFMGHYACLFDGVLVFFFGMVGISTLVIIALLRLCCTIKVKGLPHVKILLVFTYIYAGFWSGAPLFGWGGYDIEPSRLICGLTWYKLPKWYFTPLVITGYIIPTLVIAYCYLKIWLSISMANGDRVFQANATQKVSMTKVTFYTCLAFIITWTPYTVFGMLAYCLSRELTSPYLSVIPGLFAKTCILLNPLIYFYMVKRFRAAAIATICCRKEDTLEKTFTLMTRGRTASSENGIRRGERIKLRSVSSDIKSPTDSL